MINGEWFKVKIVKTVKESNMKSMLLNMAVMKHADMPASYQYDHQNSMNMVCKDGIKMPFIDSKERLVCLMSKTEAYRESDDYLDVDLDLMCRA